MWEFFPKIMEWLADSVSRDQVAAFCQDHSYAAAVLFLVILLLLGFAVINGFIEFNHKVRHWSRSRRGKILLLSGFGIAAIVSCLAVYAVPDILEPTPEFKLQKTIYIGEPMIISWKYNWPRADAANKKIVRYQLQSASDHNFGEGSRSIILDSSYRYVSHPEIGKRYWRVRPVVRESAEYVPLSGWSQPVETTYYRNTLDRIKATGAVTVLISNSDEQGLFKFIENGAFGGFDIDLIKAIVADLPAHMHLKTALTAQLMPSPWLELLGAPAAGRADVIISTITKRQQRELDYKIRFSDTYYCTTQSILYRDDTPFTSTMDVLKNSRLGVEKGTTSEQLVTALRKYHHIDLALRTYAEVEHVISAVALYDIDYAVIDTPFAIGARLKSYADRTRLKYRELGKADFPAGFPKSMETDEYGIAVRKGDDQLLEMINQILEKMKKDGRLVKLMRTAIKHYTSDLPPGSRPEEQPDIKAPWLCNN